MRIKILLIIAFLYVHTALSQSAKVCDFQYLSQIIKPDTDTLKVVNFWATWCRPCVEELKYFKQATEAYKGKKVKFIFVSLDFSSQKTKVDEFLKKQNISGSFYILTGNPNEWINKIDPDWAGDIPYTFAVYTTGRTAKINKSIQSYDELDALIRNQF